MNTQNQVQISSINNDATSKKNQVDATNAKEVTKWDQTMKVIIHSVKFWWRAYAFKHLRFIR